MIVLWELLFIVENEEALDWVQEDISKRELTVLTIEIAIVFLDNGNKEACVFDKYCRLAERFTWLISRKYLIGASANFEDLIRRCRFNMTDGEKQMTMIIKIIVAQILLALIVNWQWPKKLLKLLVVM